MKWEDWKKGRCWELSEGVIEDNVLFILHTDNNLLLYYDGSRGFSVDQLKRKQPLLTFQPDAPVVFWAKSSEDDWSI